MKRFLFLATLGVCALLPMGAGAANHLSPAARKVLVAYVTALQHEHYADAFALLTNAERSYFRNATNFASIFKADDVTIKSFRVIGSRDAGTLGVLGLVSENIAFLDQAHQAPGTATVTVPYGLISSGSSYLIKDPFHPWRAVRPPDAEATVSGLRVNVRKVSLFAGRVEVVVTFANIGDGFVTLLPYGRSVARTDDGTVLHPIATKSSALTDKQLYLGLRLAPSAEYTGALTFSMPSPHTPRTLTLTLAPMLRDGADTPFSIDLPSVEIGA